MKSIESIERDDAATLERIARLVRELKSETECVIEPEVRDVVEDSVATLSRALKSL